MECNRAVTVLAAGCCMEISEQALWKLQESRESEMQLRRDCSYERDLNALAQYLLQCIREKLSRYFVFLGSYINVVPFW